MRPTIGRIVIYKPVPHEKMQMELDPKANVQEKLPAVIVAVWDEFRVNLKVLKDGEGEIWLTEVEQGNSPGHWNWSERV